MSSKLTSYAMPSRLQSVLLRNTPEALPTVSELKSLQTELEALKLKLKDRGQKARADIKVIEESMRRMKEGEKGKAKSVEKVKRERDFTPMPDAEEPRISVGKPRLPSHPLPGPSSSSRSSVDPRSLHDDRKKKKRKRDYDEVDLDPRNRKGTPPVHPAAQPPPPAKAQKSISISASHPKHSSGPDFSVPPPPSLLPTRPPINSPPKPGPSRTIDVQEDFSHLKQPQQTPALTFYSSIEPWIRNLKEEDIGFLEHTGDEIEPFILPKLGRHYQEIWDEQDAGLIPTNEDAPKDLFAAPIPKWDPSTLVDDDCGTEEHGHGPLTERVISALLPLENQWKGVKDAEDAMEGRPGGSGAAASKKEKLSVSDLETRIRDTMRYHGLLTEIPDYSEKVDDPITTAIREGQRELRTVMARNKVRRGRLVEIARDRLAYQEYVELRESIDKNVNNAYARLQRKDAPKPKKKKSDSNSNSNSNGPPSPPPPCPAALGLGPTVDNELVVPEPLQALVKTRRQWVDQVGCVFEDKEAAQPGRIWGVPKTSVYEGLEDEVQAMLGGGNVVLGKRARVDDPAMDMG